MAAADRRPKIGGRVRIAPANRCIGCTGDVAVSPAVHAECASARDVGEGRLNRDAGNDDGG